MKQVPWQLTDQTCKLLEGIRCEDSLAIFVGQEATALTMKSTKGLKETRTLPWTRKTGVPNCFYELAHGIARASFLNELAHGIARAFMVDSFAWRLLMPFMIRGVQSHSFVDRRFEM